MSLYGQRGFDLAVVAGFNASQIAGDALAGFNKPGIHAGLNLGFRVSEKFDVNLDLLFSQKGSWPRRRSSLIGQRTNLNYAEFPVYVTLNDWYNEDGDYFKVGIYAGLAYAYLISGSSGVGVLEDELENFKSFDMGALAGAYYAFTPRLRLNFRYSNSFIKIYKNDGVILNEGLINYLCTFRVDFLF